MTRIKNDRIVHVSIKWITMPVESITCDCAIVSVQYAMFSNSFFYFNIQYMYELFVL